MERRTILAISSGNYLVESGGVNKVIYDHANFYKMNGVVYNFLYPLSMPQIGLKNISNKWVFINESKEYKVVTIKEIISFVRSGNVSAIHIHHYEIGRISEIEQIVLSNDDIPVVFILHDYWTVCPNYKNSLKCDFNEASKIKECIRCKYHSEFVGSKFANHFNKIGNRLYILSPSDYALNVWREFYGKIEGTCVVLPHQIYKSVCESKVEHVEGERKKRIAFVGSQIDYKGWEYYKACVQKAEAFPWIEFYQFGKGESKVDNLIQINVDFHDNSSNMTQLLKQNNIDVGVLLSIIGETYSFTYYECMAADVFVISCASSGNIATQIKKNKNGIILSNPDRLEKLFFEKEKLLKAFEKYKSTVHKVPNEYITNPDLMKYVGRIISGDSYKIHASKMLSIIYNVYRNLSMLKRRASKK